MEAECYILWGSLIVGGKYEKVPVIKWFVESPVQLTGLGHDLVQQEKGNICCPAMLWASVVAGQSHYTFVSCRI